MSQPRRHDIDALRALAFGFLILYHIGMFYVSWSWHIKSDYSAPWLEPLMQMLNQWRMPLLFFISGLAVTFLLGDPNAPRISSGQFIRLRLKRLLLPLVFGMLVIIPPQAYIEALSKGVIEPGYGYFLYQYFTFYRWPAGSFSGADIGFTWNHLWYLPYVLFYSLVIVTFHHFLPRLISTLRCACSRLSGFWLWLIPILWLIPLGLWVFPRFPYISHDLLSDGYAHAMYGSFFLFGFIIGKTPAIWAKITRLRWWMLVLAPFSFTLYLSMNEWEPQRGGALRDAAQSLVVYMNRWTWMMLVLGWGHHTLNRPMRWLPYTRRAVYPWYILHQTIIVVAAYYLSALQLGPWLEPVLLITVTIAGCAAGAALIDYCLPWLRPAFGMPLINKAHDGGTAPRSTSETISPL